MTEVGFLSPGGTNENSPAFQRRVRIGKVISPGGTADPADLGHNGAFNRPFGTHGNLKSTPGAEAPGYCHDVPPGQGEDSPIIESIYP